MNRSATGTANRPCHSSRPGLLASALSPRPSRLGPLASALSPRPSLALAKAVLLMSLALFTLGLLSAPPVQAQGPGGWQLDHYECTGADTWTDGDGGHTNPWPATTTSQLAFGHQYGSPDQSVGTVTAVFTWQGGGQPTDRIPLVITSYADAAGAPFGPPADDGFGDPGNGNGENCSAGMHLVKVANPDHKATVKTRPYSLSAICGSSGYTTWVTFQASIDTSDTPRDVTITSSIDPTYHRETDSSGKPSKKENTPDAAGTVTADSVNLWPSSLPRILYTAVPTGSWDPNSSYHWYSAATGNFDAGTFAPPPFPVVYPPIAISNQEHVNLHCIDASDGASATANYYVNWHNPIEGWVRTSMISNPLPTGGPTGTNNIGDWQVYGSFPNNNPTGTPPNTTSCAVGNQQTLTVTGTIGGQQTTTATGGDVSQAFQTNESISLSKAYQSSTTETYTAQLPAGRVTYIYWGVGWTDRSGTCDLYDIHGFNSTVPWDAHVPNIDPQGNLVILWAVFTTTPPP